MPASSLRVSLAPKPQGEIFLEIKKSHRLIAAFLDKSISSRNPIFSKRDLEYMNQIKIWNRSLSEKYVDDFLDLMQKLRESEDFDSSTLDDLEFVRTID